MEQTDNFIMLPTVDFCFKELMQNDIVRQGFVAALLRVNSKLIQDTTLLPTILSRRSEDDKLGILDVRILLKDGTQMDLEMQVRPFEFWDERALFYLCTMFTEQIHKGESYATLKKCIHVSILDFIHFPNDNECYRTIHLSDDNTGNMYSDKLEMQFLELKKLPPDVQTGEDIIHWMKFFSGKSREEFESMADTNEYLSEAYNTLLKLSADEMKKLEYDAREKALKDYNTQMGCAEKRGKEQGIQITKQVYKLHAQGLTPAEIADICSISLETIQDILA